MLKVCTKTHTDTEFYLKLNVLNKHLVSWGFPLDLPTTLNTFWDPLWSSKQKTKERKENYLLFYFLLLLLFFFYKEMIPSSSDKQVHVEVY